MSEVQRAPAAGDWRTGAGAVVVVTIEVDGELAPLGLGEHHAADISDVSDHVYGTRVGLPRLLQVIGQLQVPATFFVPGLAAERWRSSIEAIKLAGHEIALHGHSHKPLTHMSDDEQRADLEAGVAALNAIGIAPRGYRAPFTALARTTLDLLAGAGMIYDSSLLDDDKPYRLRTVSGPLAELPVTRALDDARHPDPDHWLAEIEAMRGMGALCVLTLRDFVSGRPGGAKGLERFLKTLRERGDVRFARADQVAEAVAGITASGSR